MPEPEALPGKQQVKSQRAQDAICEATIKSLYEVGYAETTLNKVAAMAGFSKGALQHHFPSKEDLIASAVDRLLERTIPTDKHKILKHDSVAAALLWSWQKLVNTEQYRALLEVLNAARADKKLKQRISENLLTWGHSLDNQAISHYEAINGDEADVKALLSMTRSFMRGLIIQEQYNSDPTENLNQVKRWIDLMTPLLALKAK